MPLEAHATKEIDKSVLVGRTPSISSMACDNFALVSFRRFHRPHEQGKHAAWWSNSVLFSAIGVRWTKRPGPCWGIGGGPGYRSSR